MKDYYMEIIWQEISWMITLFAMITVYLFHKI